jgi:phage major head subunit gpT-like protein
MFVAEDFNQNPVMDNEFAYEVSEDCEVFGYFYQMLDLSTTKSKLVYLKTE